jgi:hypothetical protein
LAWMVYLRVDAVMSDFFRIRFLLDVSFLFAQGRR